MESPATETASSITITLSVVAPQAVEMALAAERRS